MLPAKARLTKPAEFRSVMRGGVRVARDTVVVHALPRSTPPSRAGFVVSKAVGNAVTRNRVKRQLRHLVAAELATSQLPVDAVIRALPRAATGSLGRDFSQAWAASQSRVHPG
ncbi:MAG: ribonuclease P protein component [Propioniciclava sp.]